MDNRAEVREFLTTRRGKISVQQAGLPDVGVRNGRMDLLATNPLGLAMHSSLYDNGPTSPPNFARYTFLDSDSHRFYPHWDVAADTCVAILRTEAGRDPHDKELHDLVGELSTLSGEFRDRWSSHDVRYTAPGPRLSTTESPATSSSLTRAWI